MIEQGQLIRGKRKLYRVTTTDGEAMQVERVSPEETERLRLISAANKAMPYFPPPQRKLIGVSESSYPLPHPANTQTGSRTAHK